jgi:hypothetical protein
MTEQNYTKQYTIIDYISTFEQLEIYIEGLSDSLFKECFISGLKEEIREHIMMQCPKTWLEDCERDKEVEMVINAQTKIPLFTTPTSPLIETTPIPSNSYPMRIHKLSQEEMEESQCLHLFYNCDE